MNNKTANDGELLAAAAAGREAAFAALYQRYAGRLYAYFYPRCGKDQKLAEDLRQQVFLQLLESKAFAEAKGGIVRPDLSSLLFSISANLLKNTYRSRERRQRQESTFGQLSILHRETTQQEIDPKVLDAALNNT